MVGMTSHKCNKNRSKHFIPGKHHLVQHSAFVLLCTTLYILLKKIKCNRKHAHTARHTNASQAKHHLVQHAALFCYVQRCTFIEDIHTLYVTLMLHLSMYKRSTAKSKVQIK
jgi:hypothetical protein